MATKLLAWHFSTSDRVSRFDGREIVAGKTLTVKPPLSMCYHGLHASVNILDACNYAPGSYIWRVELSGEVTEGEDKAVATRRKALWGYDATDVLRAFARKVALEAVEKYWDAQFGEFPAVALQYLRTGDKSLRLVAESAAWSAAESAARSAAESAAWSAAWSAARSANNKLLTKMIVSAKPKAPRKTKVRKMD